MSATTAGAARRYPIRTNRGLGPRRPDSPISLAPRARQVSNPTADEDGSDSDSELVRAVALGFEAAAERRHTQSYVAMNEDVLESRDTSSPELGLRADNGGESAELPPLLENPPSDDSRENTPDIEDLDTQEGSVQTRATNLVNNILRLRSLEVWALRSYTIAPSSPHPSSPGPSSPLGVAVSLRYTTQQGGPKCLYFVGIQTLTGCRTFCEAKEFGDPYPYDGALFLRLQNSGGPLGRALATITDRALFFAGISDVPVDIDGNYSSYQNNFKEIDSLLRLEQSLAPGNTFFPIPASTARSELLATQGQPETIPVYVLYVYHQDAEVLSTHTPTPYVHPSSSMAAATPRAVDPVQEYLRQQYAPQYAELDLWRSRDYGSAYTHCLIERQIVAICTLLNITVGRGGTPAVVGNLSIRLDDVVSAAGVNVQTFSGIRTEFRMIREVHVALRQRRRSNTVPIDYVSLLSFLDIMLAERILNTACTNPAPSTETSEIEATVARCQISTLMGRVRGAHNMFSL
ncbi:hypothetical protein K438DRAFT_1980970 [Mycena galopus ATCC 62051]|nr:hypothetical protein K438DRAFT_1980970 [Mycena galopus ATCC 62051]